VIAAVVLVGVWLGLHLPITDLVERLLPWLGLAAYDRLWSVLGAAMGLGFAGFVLLSQGWTLGPVHESALGLLIGVVLAWALLISAPIEYVHFPQYAAVSALFARGGLPLDLAWLATTGLGAIDESYQFLFLPRARPPYFDWNDIVLNALGAGFGLVVMAARRRVPFALTFSATQIAVVVAIAALVALAIAPLPGPPWLTETPRHTWFRVLSPIEALVLLALVWGTTRQLGALRER